MARTITALFDTRADAEAGGERLRVAGVDASGISVHDETPHTADAPSTHADKGLWASVKGVFLPDADRHAYEEGVRRGGFLLTAHVDDDMTAAAVEALEESNSVDLDERTSEWRSQGWASPTATAADDTVDAYGDRDSDLGGVRFRSYSARPMGSDTL